MEAVIPSPYPQVPATCPCPEPNPMYVIRNKIYCKVNKFLIVAVKNSKSILVISLFIMVATYLIFRQLIETQGTITAYLCMKGSHIT
jgi:hypothetical protein